MHDVYVTDGKLIGMADDPRGIRLRAILSVIYTLASVFVRAGGSFDSGGAQ